MLLLPAMDFEGISLVSVAPTIAMPGDAGLAIYLELLLLLRQYIS